MLFKYQYLPKFVKRLNLQNPASNTYKHPPPSDQDFLVVPYKHQAEVKDEEYENNQNDKVVDDNNENEIVENEVSTSTFTNVLSAATITMKPVCKNG